MPKNCDTCIHWEFVYDDGDDRFGKCNNILVTYDVRVIHEEDIEHLFTCENFGCVYHEDSEKVVMKIKPEK